MSSVQHRLTVLGEKLTSTALERSYIPEVIYDSTTDANLAHPFHKTHCMRTLGVLQKELVRSLTVQ
jgi:hypothetical protein